MSGIILCLSLLVIFIAVAIMVDKRQQKPKQIMWEGKLLKSEIVIRDGEKFYVEKVAFKDWHVSIHSYYLISE